MRSDTVRLGHIPIGKREIIVILFTQSRPLQQSNVNSFSLSSASHGSLLLRSERSAGGGSPSGREEIYLAREFL